MDNAIEAFYTAHTAILQDLATLNIVTKTKGRLASDPAELQLAIILQRGIMTNMAIQIASLNEQIADLRKPWYKKLFRK